MSIAVSAIVAPSRLLFALVCAMSSIVLVVGLMIVFGHVGELAPGVAVPLGAACVFAAVFGVYHGVARRKPIHIDISGEGRIRLRELHAARSCRYAEQPHLQGQGQLVSLLESSTIWPNLLLLRLQDEGGTTRTVPILPDCVSRDSFRALSVACRWIAAHGVRRGQEDC
jgi:hypothetical protein